MKKKQREAAKKSESRWRGSRRLDVARERELWVTDAQRARQTKGGKGDTVFKWPNQGTSPSKGELVCVCVWVNVCVWAGRMGRLHIDRLSPSSPAIINLPIPSSSSSPPSSPERPKLLYPSTTHSGLNKAAPRLPTHTRTHTYTHILQPHCPVDFGH